MTEIVPHPEFGLAGTTAIVLPQPWRDRRTADYLAHCVVRSQGNLRAHARRIALHHLRGDAPELAAATIDLFIALADKGRSLKRLLLQRHREELARAGCYAVLAAHLECALPPHLPQIALPGSLLCRPWSGVVVRDPDDDPGPSEEEVRRELIEELRRYGLKSEARELEEEQ